MVLRESWCAMMGKSQRRVVGDMKMGLERVERSGQTRGMLYDAPRKAMVACTEKKLRGEATVVPLEKTSRPLGVSWSLSRIVSDCSISRYLIL